MSREKDLIDLIRTANEVYLINPTNNVRTAYILIDDLCELMTKFYLQSRNAQWSANNDNGYFKRFHEIIAEVKAYFGQNQNVENLLKNFESRRKNRNRFFRDHKMTGLTVTSENCLEAFCDLYKLLDILFPNAVNQNQTALYMAQVATIKVLNDCVHDHDKKNKFNNITKNWENFEGRRNLKTKGEIIIVFPNLGYDYLLINYHPQRFYDALMQAGLILP